MKHLLLFLLLIATTLCTAQRLTMDKVPPAAARAFKAKFPEGSQPGWLSAGKDVYEVQFFNGKKRQSALFDATGKWLQTQTEMDYGKMPRAVQRAFEQDYQGYQAQEVCETDTPDKGLCYEVTAFNPQGSFVALFTAKGELVRKEEGQQ